MRPRHIYSISPRLHSRLDLPVLHALFHGLVFGRHHCSTDLTRRTPTYCLADLSLVETSFLPERNPHLASIQHERDASPYSHETNHPFNSITGLDRVDWPPATIRTPLHNKLVARNLELMDYGSVACNGTMRNVECRTLDASRGSIPLEVVRC
ncbi:hypothetical protein BS50DRAFT_574275 [Corynespora cassiicola Philippines]|uniref:Uncharacterized protein n=1 Tax=Corynespora cassiicola Philippines TaxID=1448308 RepID=A0A2T2NJX9_CORCC|nr:hypothetical protein BS50DRAFT_574275 [Corynespora cassiicola Philippines]